MATIEQRLQALEMKSNLQPLIIIVDDALTDAQQKQVNEAYANKRVVVQLISTDLKL